MNKKVLGQIWEGYSKIITDMLECNIFFEGYITDISIESLDTRLLTVSDGNELKISFIWEEINSDKNINLSLAESVELFLNKQIATLIITYDLVVDKDCLSFTLLLDYCEPFCINILCGDEVFRCSDNLKETAYNVLVQMEKIKNIFDGTAMFISHETSRYPSSCEDFPSEWIKVS